MHPHIHAPQAELDDAVAVSDQEAVFMAHYLMQKEGLFVGSSSAINVVATLKYAKEMPPGRYPPWYQRWYNLTVLQS